MKHIVINPSGQEELVINAGVVFRSLGYQVETLFFLKIYACVSKQTAHTNIHVYRIKIAKLKISTQKASVYNCCNKIIIKKCSLLRKNRLINEYEYPKLLSCCTAGKGCVSFYIFSVS